MNVTIHKTRNGYYCVVNGNTAFAEARVFQKFVDMSDWLHGFLEKEENEENE